MHGKISVLEDKQQYHPAAASKNGENADGLTYAWSQVKNIPFHQVKGC